MYKRQAISLCAILTHCDCKKWLHDPSGKLKKAGNNMKITGLITEYNPFHNGHLYHIRKSKEVTGSDYCIALMSGSYVQRGAPAIYDKYVRTAAALSAGADLVVEMPVSFSTADVYKRQASPRLPSWPCKAPCPEWCLRLPLPASGCNCPPSPDRESGHRVSGGGPVFRGCARNPSLIHI